MASISPEQAPGRLNATDEIALAMLPGLLALLTFFGWGTPVNALWAVPAALAANAFSRRDRAFSRSALPGAMVIAISLPPASPWWLVVGASLTATSVRLASRKGWIAALNPAMVAFAFSLLLFPELATRWIAPTGAPPLPTQPFSLIAALQIALGFAPAAQIDGFTMATPLALLHGDTSHTIAELKSMHPQFGALGGRGWEWAGAGFLLGGLYLAWRGLLAWRPAAGILGSLLLLAALLDDGSSASAGPGLLHVFSGGTLFAACFVISEPAGLPRSLQRQLAFGILTGVLVFLLRVHGSYADGIAFAVLIGNALFAPFPHARQQSGASTWPRALTLLLAAGLFIGAWHTSASKAPDEANALALDIINSASGAGHATVETFSALDAELLGYREARTAWRARDGSGTITVVLPARAPDGYAGAIDLLVGIHPDGSTAGVRVLAQAETPGIGDAINADTWLGSLRGKTAGFDAISGATVSSTAVTRTVERALRHFEIHRDMLLDTTVPKPVQNTENTP